MTSDQLCEICGSGNHVDNHHLDCLGGQLSPETVPLCRRCHKTYHIWGVGAFSPDTTEEAVEVENKRREILRSLLPEHPLYQKLSFSRQEAQTSLKLEDVRRSWYWYRKWGIKPPREERAKAKAVAFRLPNSPPLCGEEWVRSHLNDYTPEEIGVLAIEVACDGRWMAPIEASSKKGSLKKTLREVARR